MTRHSRVCLDVFSSLLVGLVLSSCVWSDPSPPGLPSATPPPGNDEITAEATVGDIAPVITLDASVVAPIAFQVTAWADGTLILGQKQFAIQPDGEPPIVVTFDNQYRDFALLVNDGAKVVAGQPIANVTYGSFTLRAAVSPVDELRFLERPVSARAALTGANGPFDCQLLDPVPSIEADSTFIACAIPSDVRAIVGITGIIAIRFPGVESAITLPLAAVSGSQDRGEVLKKVDNEFVTTEVRLGVSDGVRIEIRSGVAVGDIVRVPGPGLFDD